MLDGNRLSDNMVTVTGVLNELEVIEGVSQGTGKEYVRGTATVRVDQSINGQVTENLIPVKLFSMKYKNDGSENQVYKNILGYKDKFISIAAAENESDASRVTISGAKIEENAWFDAKSNVVRSTYQISANFINKAKEDEQEKATFEFSGVVGKMYPEVRNDEETGRIIVDFVVITWGPKANKIQLVAEGSAADFITTHWQAQDTVKVTGRVNMTHKVEIWTEEQGFGEPIERSRTVSKKELVITGGSPSGLNEDQSYDIDAIKQLIDKRNTDHAQLANAPSTNKASNRNKPVDFGF